MSLSSDALVASVGMINSVRTMARQPRAQTSAAVRSVIGDRRNASDGNEGLP